MSGGTPTLSRVTDPPVPAAAPPGHERVRRMALSPSRAADFRQCPLLYRFRAIDRLPERRTRAQVRGTLVHAVLERLYTLPAADRVPAAAHGLVVGEWERLLAGPGSLVAEIFAGPDDPETGPWLEAAGVLLDTYFRLEDPRLVEPAGRELLVEAELASAVLGSGVPLRGYVDRLDVSATGVLRVVDYKTGAAPGQVGEARVLFPMKFYALTLLLLRGGVPAQLRLLYLADGVTLTYSPDADELHRFARILEAIWVAVLAAGATGDFRAQPGPLCTWCDHRPRCPAWGGTPPPYPGWPTGVEDRPPPEDDQ